MARYYVLELLCIALAIIAAFALKLVRERRRYINLPGPPHNFIFGHILILIKHISELPPNLSFLVVLAIIGREYNLGPVWYFDIWPLGSGTCVILDPNLASQITQTTSLPKWPDITNFLAEFMGRNNIALAEGPHWKRWRNILNPGFSTAHLTTLIPTIVHHGQTFIERLEKYAKSQEIVALEPLTGTLTFDIIGAVTLDVDFKAQRSRSELLDLMRIVPTLCCPPGTLNPFTLYNPWRILRHNYYFKRFDKIVGELVDERLVRDEAANDIGKSKSVIALALKAYKEEVEAQGTSADLSDFRENIVGNIRSFLFAGYDTSSSSICYIFSYLSKHPEILQKLRTEHSEIFGPDPTAAATLLKETPALLSKLPYTTAVINETLRIMPPAGTVRQGQPGLDLIDPATGTHYPTYRSGAFGLQIFHFGLQRHASNFADPDSFDPSRFLAEGGGERGAFMPFGKGPRNCIGQELAMVEMRVVLVLTVRSFEVRPAYAGGVTVLGERAYPVIVANSKPVDELPVKIGFAEG